LKKSLRAIERAFVDIERSLARLTTRARKAARAADKAGVVLQVGQSRRRQPANRKIKAMIDAGELGKVLQLEGNQSSPAGHNPNLSQWRRDPRESPAGGMTAMGVHNLDAMIHLFGLIDEVYATSIRRAVAYDAEDTTSAMFGFANGMSGTLLTSLVTAVTYRFAVFGTKGCAELLTPEFDFRFSPVPSGPPTGRNVAAEPEIIHNRGFNGILAELEAFAAAIDVKHVNIHGHSLRVGRYAAAIGEALGMGPTEVAGLRSAGYLHDIGKVAVDKRLFGKPTALDPEEFREMADHTVVGHQIVTGIEFPWASIPEIVRWHHERSDGSGYPDGLAMNDVSLPVRIVGLADTFDGKCGARSETGARPLSADEGNFLRRRYV